MSRSEQPPGPDGLPFVGIAYHFARAPFDYREYCAETYGDVVTMPGVGSADDYMLIHPDHVERVLKTEWEDYVGAPQSELEELLGNGLLINEGESWQRQRQLMQPAFFRRNLQEYTEVMARYSQRLADEWAERDRIDMEREMRNLTLQIIVQTMFSKDIKNEQTIIGSAFSDIGERFQPSRSKLPIPNWVPTPANRRFKQALDDIDEVIYGMIESRRVSDGEENEDLLNILLTAEDTNGQEMSDKQLRDEMMTMLLAGHDTTALSITYTWYLLAKHEDVEEKLLAELDEVLGDELPTFRSVTQLDYLSKVINESMRLYPAVHSISRRATTDVEFEGYVLPEGSRIFLAPWVTHRDGRFWGDPETFRPERWDQQRVEQRPDYAFFPFGGGPRECIGKKFARLEAQFIIATILQRYSFELVSDGPLELVASITAQPKGGIDMVARAR